MPEGSPIGTGNISFRLLDVATVATAITTGTMAGTVNPGEAMIYRFNAQAGDSLVYTPVDVGALSGQWHLVTGSGEYISAGSAIGQSQAIRNLPSASAYYLIWDTDADPTVSATGFSFNLNTVTPAAAQPLTLDAITNGTLAADGTLSYEFQVTGQTMLWLDALSNVGDLNWQLIDSQNRAVSSGIFSATLSAPITLGAAGTYTLNFTPRFDSALPSSSNISFKLSNLATAATILPTDTQTQGTLDPGTNVNIYRFTASGDDRFQFRSYGVAPTGVNWRLFTQSGNLVRTGTVGTDSAVFNLSNYGTGSYYLLIDGAVTNTSATNYSFAASLNRTPLAFNTTLSGTVVNGSNQRYVFHLDQPTWEAFDALKDTTINYNYDTYVSWWLDGPQGQVFSSQMYYPYSGAPRDSMRMLGAGDYVLTVSNGVSVPVNFKFRALDTAGATVLAPDTTINGTLTPGNTTNLYRFDATAGESYCFKTLQSIGAYWRLIDSAGQEIYNANYSYNQDLFNITTSGTYLLAIEGANNITAAQSYSFNLIQAVNKPAPVINTQISDAIDQNAVHRYSVHLDQSSWLVYDNLPINVNTSNVKLVWRLDGPQGVVFNGPMYSLTRDTMQQFAPGDYILTISSGPATNYLFRLLDMSSATTIVPGTPTTISVTPANGVSVYRFDATAGERYYFDANNTSYINGYWKVVDPFGRVVVDKSYNSDSEQTAFSVSGTYLLVFEGLYNNYAPTQTFTFNVVRVPNNPTIVLDTLVVSPAPDLFVNSVLVTPDTGLETGDTLQVQWVEENRGVQATAGSWNDRVLLINLDTGEQLASLMVPYDEAGTGNGAILTNEARTRSATITIPDGSRAAGRIGVMVIADATNAIREGNTTGTGEGNNARTLEVQVALALYADLVAEGVTLTPNGNYAPGTVVTAAWTTANRGTRDVTQSWSERLEVVNLSTNQVIATNTVVDNVAVNGALAINGTRARSVQFTWPSGVSAAGRFAFRIVLDSTAVIPEANLSGTGEGNNSTETIRISGPDLRIRNLLVNQPVIEAGGLVTVNWEDWNDGAAPTPANFNDRIVVTNRTTGERLLDTSLLYNQGATGAGAIEPGQSRARSFTFRLLDGLRGTGEIQISITADQNSAGFSVLYETNLAGDAELNNAAATVIQSAAKLYPDLRVTQVNVPANADAGSSIDISWRVENAGQVDTSVGWVDRIVISKDTVIGNGDDIVLAHVPHSTPLASAGAYTQTASIRLPTRIQGAYYIGVVADALSSVVEPDTRSDNSRGSSAITIAQVYADLVPEITLLPADPTAGRSTRVEWTVRNQGTSATDVNHRVDQREGASTAP
jgi:hypothetical protein